MAYKRKPYRIKRRVKVVFWSFIALIIFSIALIFMEKPTKGVIVQQTLESDETVQVDPSKTNTVTTKYFSLTYDAALDTVSDISSSDKTALEVYRLARSDPTGRRTFVVTIKKLPAGGMGEESSYKFRHINPTVYRESVETVGDLPFVIMEKLEGTELTGFVVKGDKLAMLAYTIDAPEADLHKEGKSLLGAFHWLE